MSDEPDLKRSRRKKQIDDPSLDKLPPSASEAEQALLGCILIDSRETMPEAQSKIPTSDVFFDMRHRAIYETLVEMANDQDPITSATVMARLGAFGQLPAIGGAQYLSSLADAASSGSNIDYYLNIILEKYQLRRLLQLCTETAARIYEADNDTAALLDSFESEATRIRMNETGAATANCADSVTRALETIEAMERSNGPIGLSTGFPDLDKMLNGLHEAEMIIIAGRPSLGKSSIAMNFAENIAITQRVPVGIFSLEMTKDSLVLRTLCSRAEVNIRHVSNGYLTEIQKQNVHREALVLRKAPIYIDDTPGLTVAQLRARARRMFQRFGIKLFIIDYLQQMQAVIKRGENRERGVADMSNGIKLLARELKIPVIALSQLSRDLERSKERKPTMADLRESGAIEQDADVIGILYRAEAQDSEDDIIPVSLLIAKQRNGPTGNVEFLFKRSLTRFLPVSKVAQADVPPTKQDDLSYYDNQPPDR
jgi:replicative DNA helicase